jgi:hypothetical protein
MQQLKRWADKVFKIMCATHQLNCGWQAVIGGLLFRFNFGFSHNWSATKLEYGWQALIGALLFSVLIVFL